MSRCCSCTTPQHPAQQHSSSPGGTHLRGRLAAAQPQRCQHPRSRTAAAAAVTCSAAAAIDQLDLQPDAQPVVLQHTRRISRARSSSSNSPGEEEQPLQPAAAQVLAQQAAVIAAAAAAILPQQPSSHHQDISPGQPVPSQQHHAAVQPQEQQQAAEDRQPPSLPGAVQQLGGPHTPQLVLLHAPQQLQKLLSSQLLQLDAENQQGNPQHSQPANSTTTITSSSSAVSSSSSSSSSSAAADTSALRITDRVRALVSNAAARRKGGTRQRRGSPGAAPVNVMQFCAAAGVGEAVGTLVLQHVKATRISATPDVLSPFVASYRRLAEAYGEAVVLEWLRKAPPIIRTEDEVPGRLAQLQEYLGPSASLSDVLALTRRCPQVLQVSRAVLVTRMERLCRMLRRNPDTEAGVLLVAAPALLAMQSHTLEAKLQQLQSLADTHPSWTEAYCSCPCKSLAVLLTYSLERQLRLHYAAAHGLQAQLQMNTIMAWSKRDWLKAHPRFEEWCQAYKRIQQQLLVLQQQQQQAEAAPGLPPVLWQEQRQLVPSPTQPVHYNPLQQQ